MISFKTMGSAAMLAAGWLAASPSAAVVTTFATFTGLGNGSLVWKNNGSGDTSATWRANGTGGALYTTASAASVRADQTAPGPIATNFQFTNLALAPLGNIGASFTLLASAVNQPAASVNYFATFDFQAIASGTFAFLTTAPLVIGSTAYAAGSNLLSASFTNMTILGVNHSTTASGFASVNSGAAITYTSDFLNFAPTSDRDIALSLSSLLSKLNNVNQGVNFTTGHALRSFRAGVGGSFSAGPSPLVNAVPEPQVWALLVIGFGLVGVQARRRGGAVTA